MYRRDHSFLFSFLVTWTTHNFPTCALSECGKIRYSKEENSIRVLLTIFFYSYIYTRGAVCACGYICSRAVCVLKGYIVSGIHIEVLCRGKRTPLSWFVCTYFIRIYTRFTRSDFDKDSIDQQFFDKKKRSYLHKSVIERIGFSASICRYSIDVYIVGK